MLGKDLNFTVLFSTSSSCPLRETVFEDVTVQSCSYCLLYAASLNSSLNSNHKGQLRTKFECSVDVGIVCTIFGGLLVFNFQRSCFSQNGPVPQPSLSNS